MFELKRGMKKSLFLLANTANNIKSLYTKVIYGGKKNKWRTIKVLTLSEFIYFCCIGAFFVFFLEKNNEEHFFMYFLLIYCVIGFDFGFTLSVQCSVKVRVCFDGKFAYLYDH